MQATLRDFRQSNPADAVRMRIGINTGEVLVGTLAGSDYTAMGDAVNTGSGSEAKFYANLYKRLFDASKDSRFN